MVTAILLIIFIVFIPLISIGFIKVLKMLNKKEKIIRDLPAYIKRIKDFNVTRMTIKTNSLGHIAVALDDQAKKVCFVTYCYKVDMNAIEKLNTVSHKIFNYDDIIAVEMFQDAKTISKVNRGSQMAGVAIGGVLLGGVGAVIGGLSGSKRIITKMKKLGLKVIVSSIESPVIEILFLDNIYKEVQTSSSQYKEAIKEAEEWNSLFKIIME